VAASAVSVVAGESSYMYALPAWTRRMCRRRRLMRANRSANAHTRGKILDSTLYGSAKRSTA
jgi:hypothetical protein